MSARCDRCGYHLESGGDCYPCQRDASDVKLRRALASLRRLAGNGFSVACRDEAQGALEDILGRAATAPPDLPQPEPAPVRTSGHPLSEVEIEQALLELRAEVERNRLRAVWQIVGIRGDLHNRLDPEIDVALTEPFEHEIHGKACCNPECRGTWGANCPHCHRLDHRCGSEVGPR